MSSSDRTAAPGVGSGLFADVPIDLELVVHLLVHRNGVDKDLEGDITTIFVTDYKRVMPKKSRDMRLTACRALAKRLLWLRVSVFPQLDIGS